MERLNSLQLREVFHIEFLRWLGRKVKAEHYAVKGGVNLRFFFKSFRYSEDMDLDARSIKVIQLQEAVMKILGSRTFQDNLKPFGIMSIVPPDIGRAKQTETTQRFKLHFSASSGENLFTKIEFSRRGFSGNVVVEPIDTAILRVYKLAPLLTPHYDIQSAIMQKVHTLATRATIQARDIFDLYMLTSQYTTGEKLLNNIKDNMLTKAHERVFEVGFSQFRDTVISYLSDEDRALYDSSKSWEEIQLKVASFIEEIQKSHA